VGRIADKPVARNGEILVRPMMTLTLSIDHRVLDGAMGAKLLQSLKHYLENPFNLIM
jgi:pyruvate dehydrogenase E2 component (dihydrolipoamide acetyltransferase)